MILNEKDMYGIHDIVIFMRESEKCIATIISLPLCGAGVIVEFDDDLCWLEKSDIAGYTYKSRLC